jgi:DnaK suppressor protein
MAKKVIKKSNTVKNAVAKKPAAKKVATKPAKKAVTKKPVAMAKKVIVKKLIVKKAIVKTASKKAVTPKVVAKKAPVASKPLGKKTPAPIAVIAKAKPLLSKKTPVSKKQESSSIDLDEDGNDKEGKNQAAPAFFYEPPKTFIKRPDLKEPKPFIGNDKRTRYSDKELVEFTDIIHGKLEEARRDYELLKSTLSHKDDHGTDDTSPTFKLLEDGSDVMSKEETAQLASRQEKYIQSLQNALIRIENKSYGICRITGRLIPKERLRSVPHATTSIEGKMKQYA